MSIVIRCKDLGFDCDQLIHAETEEDAFSLVTAHVEDAHEVDEVSPEMTARIKEVIRRKPITS